MDPSTPSVFNAGQRTRLLEDLSKMQGAEYLEAFNVAVYLQDAVKLILDRREEKPLETLAAYFESASKGEHVLLREVAFAGASAYNRACFLMQVARVFHSNPYYKIITALDYHQCLCLLCTDFPRTLVVEAAKVLPVHPSYINNPALNTVMVSTLSHEPVLFDKFDLADLKASVELFFYYSEFLDSAKTLFTDLLSGSFGYKEEVSIGLLLTSLRGLLSREPYSYLKHPPLDLILEALLTKANKKLQLSAEEFHTMEDVLPLLTNCGTISYSEFCLALMRHPKFQGILYDQFSVSTQTAQLLELAQEEPMQPDSSPPRDKKKRDKKKR